MGIEEPVLEHGTLRQRRDEAAIGLAQAVARPAGRGQRHRVESEPFLDARRDLVVVAADVAHVPAQAAHHLDHLVGRRAVAHQVAQRHDDVEALAAHRAQHRFERVHRGVDVGEDQISHDVLTSAFGQRRDLVGAPPRLDLDLPVATRVSVEARSIQAQRLLGVLEQRALVLRPRQALEQSIERHVEPEHAAGAQHDRDVGRALDHAAAGGDHARSGSSTPRAPRTRAPELGFAALAKEIGDGRPERCSISWSRSTNGSPSRCANRFPTAVLPAPMKPVR